MFLSQHKLTNLIVVIDNNKLESLDKTENILSKALRVFKSCVFKVTSTVL